LQAFIEKEVSRMKVGIAGTGFMGSTHAAGWKETGSLIAGFIAETVEEAQPLAAQYACRTYDSLDSLLLDIDVIDICTPTHLHKDLVLKAAKAGKHIICEKPLGRTVEEGREMIAACKKAGVRLLVAHVARFFPEYALAKANLDDNQIGRVATLRFSRGSFRPKKPAGNWFLDEEKSGGILLDLMIHDFDLARWFAGEVESVYARKVTTTHPDASIDYALAILKHRNGALSHVAGAWAYPPPTFRTSFEISGDAGMMQFDSDAASPIKSLLKKLEGDTPDVGLPSSPVSESPYTTQIKEFKATLLQNKPVRVSAEDGLAALQIAIAAMESARTGKAVTLDPLPEVLA
jgi:predicted dehydrogenase